MFKTIVTPKDNNLHISIPTNLIGKKIEVIAYSIDEEPVLKFTNSNRPSYRGALNLSAAENVKFEAHLKTIRNEWERDI